jgi:hypothetical protein
MAANRHVFALDEVGAGVTGNVMPRSNRDYAEVDIE